MPPSFDRLRTPPVRTRYAPSPTGEPHVGNIRTALFAWLYARHTGGVFILRVEDTDLARIAPGALEAIQESLRWLGLDWDEGPEVGGPHAPYIQSERTRLGVYQEYSQRLLDSGWAYQCYCPPERLDEVRREQQRQKLPPMYDRHCRDPRQREAMGQQHPGAGPVVRFAVPQEGHTAFTDLVRDEITVANATLDDFVLLKSDGFPTYHLSNVVDDRLMEITHVIRGDEWLPSTPRHILLYRALGWDAHMPAFVHLPLILGPDRAKLSKRHGATSVTDYQRLGYLPEALVNFLALLGWSLDDKTELMTREDLVQHFSLERIGKTAAVFNKDKLDWMNGVYIRGLGQEELAERLLPFLERRPELVEGRPKAEPARQGEGGLPDTIARPIDRGYLHAIVPLIQERLKLLSEAPGLVDFFFQQELTYEDKALNALKSPEATRALEAALARLELQSDFSHEALEALLRPMAEELGLKTGVFFGLLRAAVTGRTVSPPLFETMAVLGRTRCLARVKRALGLVR
ncbi:MAG: glutamate--tRNA ligase [Chloroflexi bacterium]|nr:glutamate--tRNA ligase [Chloroflexota bacterium]